MVGKMGMVLRIVHPLKGGEKVAREHRTLEELENVIKCREGQLRRLGNKLLQAERHQHHGSAFSLEMQIDKLKAANSNDKERLENLLAIESRRRAAMKQYADRNPRYLEGLV